MKLRADKDAFADAVAWCAKALPARPSQPILAGALLQLTDDRLTVSGYDYEVSAQVDFDVSGDDGAALVSGRLLAEIVKALPAKPITMEVSGSRAELTCGSARFTLPTMPVEDYPALPQMPEVVGTVDATAFATAVTKVVVAAGRDDTMPVMTGIQCELSGDTMALLATDRYRMSLAELAWRPLRSDIDITTLIPARTLALTTKTLAAIGGDIDISASDNMAAGGGLVGFAGGGKRTTTRVLDGRLPDLRSYVSQDFSTRIRVPTNELIQVARRVSLVTQRHSQLRLQAHDNGLIIEAGDGEDAQASESLPCRYDGPAMRLAFNPGYLLDGLSATGAPMTDIEVDDRAARVRLTGAASEADAGDFGDFRYVTVPLRWGG